MGADGTSNVELIFKAIDEAEGVLDKLRRNLGALGTSHSKLRTETDSLSGSNAKLDLAMQAVLGSVRQATSAFGEASPAVAGMVASIEGVLAAASGVGGIVAGATAAIAGLSVASIIASKSIGEFQQKVDEIHNVTGLSSREIGALTLGAANVGRTFDQIEPSLDTFVRKLGEARDGIPDAVDAFKAVSVVGADLNQSTGVLLQQVGQYLEGLQDPARRATDAFGVFGRQWHSIEPVITQDMKENGAAAQAWGISLGSAAEAAARRASVAFSQLGARWQGFTNQIKANDADSGADWAKWASGLIDWLSKLQQKMHEKYELAITMKGGTAALEDHLRDFFSNFGKDDQAQSGATSPGGLNKTQSEELRAMLDQVDGIERLRAAHHLLLQDEIERLSSMRDQAIQMKDQVVAARELAILEPKIQKLSFALSEGKQYGPPAPKEFLNQGLPFPNQINAPAMTLPEGLLTETDQFLAKFADFTRILKVAGDGTTSASQAFIGFIGELKLGQSTALEFGRAMATSVRQELGNFVHEAITGTKGVVQAFGEMIAAITEQLIEKAFVSSILSLIPGVGPVASTFIVSQGSAGPGQFGPYSGHQTGGTFLRAQIGGSVAARSGVNLSGTRGFDTVPGEWGYGETILSHGLTDQLSRVLDMVMRPSGQGSGGKTEIHNHNSFNIEPHVHSPFIDRKSFRESMENEMAGIIVDVIERGSYRRDGDS